MFIDFYQWDKQNGFQLHKKITNDHIFPDSQLKMRNFLAEDVLNSEMLHGMQIYKHNLGGKGSVLNGAIKLLQQTSIMIKIFRNNKPIREMNDDRITQLQAVDSWFETWQTQIHNTNISKKAKSKCLMSTQCLEDIHCCINGFIVLCEEVLTRKTSLYVTQSIVNSDVIENMFNH
jgi:hypothetical protein